MALRKSYSRGKTRRSEGAWKVTNGVWTICSDGHCVLATLVRYAIIYLQVLLITPIYWVPQPPQPQERYTAKVIACSERSRVIVADRLIKDL